MITYNKDNIIILRMRRSDVPAGARLKFCIKRHNVEEVVHEDSADNLVADVLSYCCRYEFDGRRINGTGELTVKVDNTRVPFVDEYAREMRVFLGANRMPGGGRVDESTRLELEQTKEQLAATEAELGNTQAELSEKIAELAALAGREPAEYWLDCIDRGIEVLNGIIQLLKEGNWSSGQSIESKLEVTEPYILPVFDLGAIEEYSKQAYMIFYKCYRMLYCPEIGLGKTTTIREMFSGNGGQSLLKLPKMDTSAVTDMSGALKGLKCVRDWPDWDYSNAQSFFEFFSGCESLEELREVWLPQAQTLAGLLNVKCASIRHIGAIHAPNVENVNLIYALTPFSKLERIDELDWGSAIDVWTDSGCRKLTALKYLKIINLGKSECADYMLTMPVWGSGGEENRQSMVDTLLTYSYDRAAAGMPTATIALSASAKARLAPEELAQITAKGYTIV